MKIKYFEDTDTALLELGGGTPTETRELSEDIYLDLATVLKETAKWKHRNA
jgi:uncharacterized protein YuzE